jgi:hypothetical protein
MWSQLIAGRQRVWQADRGGAGMSLSILLGIKVRRKKKSNK